MKKVVDKNSLFECRNIEELLFCVNNQSNLKVMRDYFEAMEVIMQRSARGHP